MNKSIIKKARKLHKALAYILAVQILFWLLGGLVMSVIPLEKVHGKHLATKVLENPFTAKDYTVAIDPLRLSIANINTIRYDFFQEQPLYQITTSNDIVYINAKTGEKFDSPTIEQILLQASAHYLGELQPATIVSMAQGPREAGKRKNLWQVTYDDSVNTSLYFSQKNGKLISVRSDLWRVFDFVWMLHIMDYQEREDFNHPLLIIFAACSVLFSISGFLLLLQGFRSKKKRLTKSRLTKKLASS